MSIAVLRGGCTDWYRDFRATEWGAERIYIHDYRVEGCDLRIERRMWGADGDDWTLIGVRECARYAAAQWDAVRQIDEF